MDFSHLLQQSEGHAWLFIPTAILLGALHGLEPGHSKTMMAAFIIAIRGTFTQAVLLGLSAAISHSLIIWVLAAGALHYGAKWNAESTEPYFQIFSGLMIAALAAWMFRRLRREQKEAAEHQRQHEKEGPHGGQMEEAADGLIEVAIFETSVPPRFRVYFYDRQRQPKPAPAIRSLTIETRRTEGVSQVFRLEQRPDNPGVSYFEANDEIPEPHEFTAMVTIDAYTSEVVFSEDEHHHHHHADLANLTAGEYADAHEQEHAADIAKRFTNRTVTTPQIVWFGVTGGLMPCPAAFTILLVCLQLKKFTLGFTLVASFSFGLAITMVTTGALAAWGVRHAETRFKGFGQFARRAPYFSVVLLMLLAIFFAAQGWRHLM